jgi:poly(3-hydroxybutyrate) depolymerase
VNQRIVLFVVALVASASCVLPIHAQEASNSAVSVDAQNSAKAVADLRDYLRRGPERLETVADQPFANVALTREDCALAKQDLVDAHREHIKSSRMAEHEAKRIEIGPLTMKYFSSTFGARPEGGHSLYLSMHGGGGAPARVNDQQWENQKRLYQLEEGIYVAPRAPTDTWNLWHESHIDDFYSRLIENMIAIEGIDPNRVYITGYSAGGDGVYQLAPRMADRFGAAAMMAGHPNETQPLGLRNLPFTLHVGANDAGYDRNRKATEWKEELAKLKANDAGGYEHWVKVHAGKGHWMDRQDAEGVQWMAKYRRNMTPERVVWLQDDVLHSRFYWLEVPKSEAKAGQVIIASREGNRFSIERTDIERFSILVRDDMVDLDAPITVVMNKTNRFEGKVERNIVTMVKTLLDRGDPDAMFSGRVPLTR